MSIKFETLQPWLTDILNEMKKEIKNDYLPNNRDFARTHFGNRPISWLTPEELYPVFEKELIKGDEDLSDWVINQWLSKNGDLYEYFADSLSAINPNFEEIESLTLDQSRQIVKGGKDSFGAKNTYLFSVLNGVVFPQSILDELAKDAKVDQENQMAQAKADKEEKDLEKVVDRHQKELAKLTEKFDQKIAGIQKKYNNEIALLKKQLAALKNV